MHLNDVAEVISRQIMTMSKLPQSRLAGQFQLSAKIFMLLKSGAPASFQGYQDYRILCHLNCKAASDIKIH